MATTDPPKQPLRLLGRSLAALAAGLLLLRRGAAPARRPRRVGDLGRPLLGHALVLEGLVLLLVLDACSLARHRASSHRRPRARASSSRPILDRPGRSRRLASS